MFENFKILRMQNTGHANNPNPNANANGLMQLRIYAFEHVLVLSIF